MSELDLMLVVLLAAAAAFFAIYHAPRFVLFVAGPAVLIAAAWFFVAFRKAFFFFRSEGSAAGLVVPVLMWCALLAIAAAGIGLIRGGLWRLDALRRGDDPTGADLPALGYLRAVAIMALAIGVPYLGLSAASTVLDVELKERSRRCGENAGEVAFARALPAERLARLYEGVLHRDRSDPCQDPTCRHWLTPVKTPPDAFAEFADLHSRQLWANPPGHTYFRLKACGERNVDLVVVTAHGVPRIELRWGTLYPGPDSGSSVLWSPSPIAPDPPFSAQP